MAGDATDKDRGGVVVKVAVVTGGAGGMGLATAKIIGRDHRLVVCDVDHDRLDRATEELQALGIDAESTVCDITDRKSVDELVGLATSLGRVTAVVHSAGVSPQMGSAEMIIKVNAVGTVNITEAFLSVADAGFALVNVASVAGHMAPRFLVSRRNYSMASKDVDSLYTSLVAAANRGPRRIRPSQAYVLSKHFVIRYSGAQAHRFGEKSARILTVSPGSVDTSMGRLEEAGGSRRLADCAALRRFGKADELAELLAFCVSDKPGYLTGTDILCDGGAKVGITFRDMVGMAFSG
ncbi:MULTISPECIES: SDR family oxidoreductase [Parafrankia]|nr:MULTISPECIES: SDR family oxidoreductase [Parafrankia]MBE3200343.1 SDR family oxidoreductase [Parafrankia sp. CH37]